ncbi:DUF2797 domain-containing protein [Alicyclobacillaceae bacterium I2511]|nr:DUF2797 domain-containing protein [Alicyclobacillaceae bacterium I2511]
MLKGCLQELEPIMEEPIAYSLVGDEFHEPLNSLLGKTLELRYTGLKTCIHCGRKVHKLYQNGYCFPCVRSLAMCDLCIIKPELCHFDQGTCRDESYAISQCFVPHYVYLAFSSHVKVGITRKGRQLRRWADQGACAAILLAEVPNRKMAGEMEAHLRTFMSDRTDWRKMLQNEDPVSVDLVEVKQQVADQVPGPFQRYLLWEEQEIFTLKYPRLPNWKVNLSVFNLDKTPLVSGTLQGIKGQYLLLDTGVLNVKKFAGYHIELSESASP